MSLFVKDIMEKQFEVIGEDAPVEEAIRKIFNGNVRKTGHKTVSLMVVDGLNRLSGVITMFDILYHIRPTFLNYGIEGKDLVWDGKLEKLTKELKGKKVKQVMSNNIVSAGKDEHAISVLDRMIKNKHRRLPVIDNSKLVGVVYVSDIYYHLFKDYAPIRS